jgi:rubredoxin
MITPGTVGLLEAMADGPIADVEPVFDDRTGAISYPDAEEFLPDGERAVGLLESLADREILQREFREKVHRCPDCELTELRYTTVCPSCDSPETVRETELEHTECGHTAPRERLADEGACPGCGAPFGAGAGEYATVGDRHRCVPCAWRFEEPEGRLRCRRCSQVREASRVPETVLYRYRFEESRREWLYTQLAARGAIGDVLRRRGFETARDETVTGASGTEYLLDLYATDEERGLAVIAVVAEHPTAADVIDLHGTSLDTDAYPMVITTGEKPDEVVAELAESLDVGLLCPTESREPAVSCETSWPADPSR